MPLSLLPPVDMDEKRFMFDYEPGISGRKGNISRWSEPTRGFLAAWDFWPARMCAPRNSPFRINWEFFDERWGGSLSSIWNRFFEKEHCVTLKSRICSIDFVSLLSTNCFAFIPPIIEAIFEA